MLAAPYAAGGRTDLETLAARARQARRALGLATMASLTSQLGVGAAMPVSAFGSARGTDAAREGSGSLFGRGAPAADSAGPTGVRSAMADSGGALAVGRGLASEAGLMARLQAQVRTVSPLTAGLGGAASEPRGDLTAWQRSLTALRHTFRRLDGRSRFLHATATPTRALAGSGKQLQRGTLDIRG